MNCLNKFKTKIYIKIIIIILFVTNIFAYEVKIVTKINDEIITNVDVEKEYRYLISLNKSLQDVEKKEVLDFAKQSIIKEKIKKIELLKNYELENKNEMVDLTIERIYKSLNLNSKKDFLDYLKINDLDFNEIYKKIEIESLWNQLIFEKYYQKIIIDEEGLKKKILENPKQVESYYLYELVFDYKDKDEIKEKYKKILESIDLVGFKETVFKFSTSQSKANFGLLGWINKNALSDLIKKEVSNLSIGEITNPIIIPSGILILKLEDKRIENSDMDIQNELDEIIKFETNNQLNNYSVIHFNKVKSKLFIDEY